jgi:hypothetical protein
MAPIDLNPFDEWSEKITGRVLASLEGVDGVVNDARRVVQGVEKTIQGVNLIILAFAIGAAAFAEAMKQTKQVSNESAPRS